MGLERSGCAFEFLALLSNVNVAVMDQRSGEALSLLYRPRGPKLHPTQEVYCAILLSSATHKIEFLR